MPTKEEIKRWKDVHIPEAMGKLKEAYGAVYNDAYRASGVGFFKRYLKRFERMLDQMVTAVETVQLKRYYDTGKDPSGGGLDIDSGPIHFFHEAVHFIMNARYNQTRVEDKKAMVVLEKYLIQVHVFLERKEFDRFSVYDYFDGHEYWWNWVYSEEDHVYTIADEDLEEYVKAYNIGEKWDNEFGRDSIEQGNDRICRMLRNVIKRLKLSKR